jgi:hypothetical protein
MAVNIDMEKVFDKMEWNFLLAILHKLGFHPIWINWIQLYISTSSFSVLLNGSPFGLFSPSKGLRQGDSLSPFLLIIGTKVISCLLRISLRGFKIARSCSPLNHLLFADDLVIFTHATSGEATITNNCLDKYSFCSGQTVNINKSSILFSKNTAPSTITAIQNILPYTITLARTKHFGLPILFGKSKTATFSDILEKFHGKIEGWRSKTLSQVGKSILIKVVVYTILSYVMSSFLLPDSLCNQMEKAFKNLWWGFSKDKVHNLSLTSWKSFCSPKDQGGLGFKLMKDVNLCFIFFSNLDGSFSQTMTAYGFLCSKPSISSMVIYYPFLLNLVLGFGMVLWLLYLFYLLMLVLFLEFSRLFPFDLHLEFPLYKISFLPPCFHLFRPTIH